MRSPFVILYQGLRFLSVEVHQLLLEISDSRTPGERDWKNSVVNMQSRLKRQLELCKNLPQPPTFLVGNSKRTTELKAATNKARTELKPIAIDLNRKKKNTHMPLSVLTEI